MQRFPKFFGPFHPFCPQIECGPQNDRSVASQIGVWLISTFCSVANRILQFPEMGKIRLAGLFSTRNPIFFNSVRYVSSWMIAGISKKTIRGLPFFTSAGGKTVTFAEPEILIRASKLLEKSYSKITNSAEVFVLGGTVTSVWRLQLTVDSCETSDPFVELTSFEYPTVKSRISCGNFIPNPTCPMFVIAIKCKPSRLIASLKL